MQIQNFKDMYIAELQELASMENQLTDALRKMIEVASHSSLKNALMQHHESRRRRAIGFDRSWRNTAPKRMHIRPGDAGAGKRNQKDA